MHAIPVLLGTHTFAEYNWLRKGTSVMNHFKLYVLIIGILLSSCSHPAETSCYRSPDVTHDIGLDPVCL